MKKGNLFFISLLVFVCVISFLFMEVNANEKIILRAAHQGAPGGINDVVANKFKELVETKSQGKVEVQIYPAGQLGTVREVLESLSMGTVDILFEGLSWISQYESEFNFYNRSFLFTDIQKYVDSPGQKELVEKVRKNNGIRALSYSAVYPAMHLWTKSKPVYNLDDLKGLRLRVPDTKAYIDMWNGLGAIAMPIDWSEVYMALSQNMIDGLVHNAINIRDEKFYEQLNYCTLLGFKNTLETVYISEKKFQSFPAEIQNILEESAQGYAEFFNKEIGNVEKNAWDEMIKAGIEIIEVDRKPWFEKAHEVLIQLEKDGLWSEGLLEKEFKQ